MADKYIGLNRLNTIVDWIKSKLSGKQDALTAGEGITIDNNTISADARVDVFDLHDAYSVSIGNRTDGTAISFNEAKSDNRVSGYLFSDTPFEMAKQGELEGLQSQLGILTDLTTTEKSNLVGAINEVYEKSGEPFRVKQWASNSLNVEIPTCTEDISNTDIPKMVFSIDNVEGADYQIVGMLAYEVFDAANGGNRINCWPACQFTGNGQKELSVRWMCAGTTRKTTKRINAWVLLKHR